MAIQRVLHELQRRRLNLRGRVMGLAGNIRGLSQNVRYLDRDLNRRWFPDRLASLREQGRGLDSPEDSEQRELLRIFDRLDAQFDHPLIVLDLHTFSAEGPPFSVIPDTLRNRPLAYELRAPMILGLDDCVEGTLLGYLADLGHVGVAFEAGQHDDPRTVENHVAAIWVTLVSAGLVDRAQLPELERHEARLARAAAGLPRAVEIVYRHAITPAQRFRMDPGFCNFQRVRRGQRLAVDLGGEIDSPSAGRILMPLYQGQGDDGFFLARDLGAAQLQMSSTLRKLELDGLLSYLPGVETEGPDRLRLRSLGSRPAVRGMMRMLGYRKQVAEGGALHLRRRRQVESRKTGTATASAVVDPDLE